MLSSERMPSPTQLEGKRQEDHAEAALLRARYTILARNWRGGGGELDLVARDGLVLAFVEVRARRSLRHGRPAATVGTSKQRKLVRAALAYCRDHGQLAASIRFDVVEVVIDPRGGAADVTILRGAFDASAAHGRGAVPLW